MLKRLNIHMCGAGRSGRNFLRFALAAWISCAPSRGFAQKDVLDFMAEEAQVVTASRYLQPVGEAPAAVEVITREEIEAFGATSLWDILRFKAGVQVVEGRSIIGNRAIVTVRGFASEFVDGLQVLVDGRSVYSTLTGGVYWSQLGVQLQDIERIEVVKGPNAALYGSNSALGVVNIITRRPAGRRELALAGLAGGRRMNVASGSWEDAAGPLNYRVSATHHADRGNPAIAGGTNDFISENTVNLRADWTAGRGAKLELFAGHAGVQSGIIYPNFTFNDPRSGIHQFFQMARFTRDFANQSVEASAARAEITDLADTLGSDEARTVQYDGEALYRVRWLDSRLQTTLGSGWRYVDVRSEGRFKGDPRHKNRVERGFATQSARLSRWLSLSGAAAVEHSDTGATQPACQLAALLPVTDRNSFRLSVSRAPSLPPLYQREARIPFAPTMEFRGNRDLKPKRLLSYEAAHRWASSGFSVENTLYYMRMRGLSTSLVPYTDPALPGVMIFSYFNNDDAIARGWESKVSRSFRNRSSIYVNYTYERITDSAGDPFVRSFTPRHAANAGVVMPLPGRLTAAVQAGYKTGYRTYSDGRGTVADAPAYTRLDARLTYRAADWATLFMGGQNLGRSRHVEFADGLEVARVFYAGGELRFGGLR